jgi:hypothetical protein
MSKFKDNAERLKQQEQREQGIGPFQTPGVNGGSITFTFDSHGLHLPVTLEASPPGPSDGSDPLSYEINRPSVDPGLSSPAWNLTDNVNDLLPPAVLAPPEQQYGDYNTPGNPYDMPQNVDPTNGQPPYDPTQNT